jgi:hypothetical protein
MGWGLLPWVYCADIFPTRTQHYGMAMASGRRWLCSACYLFRCCEDRILIIVCIADLIQAKETSSMITTLGYKIYFMFAMVNIGAMATFSL